MKKLYNTPHNLTQLHTTPQNFNKNTKLHKHNITQLYENLTKTLHTTTNTKLYTTWHNFYKACAQLYKTLHCLQDFIQLHKTVHNCATLYTIVQHIENWHMQQNIFKHKCTQFYTPFVLKNTTHKSIKLTPNFAHLKTFFLQKKIYTSLHYVNNNKTLLQKLPRQLYWTVFNCTRLYNTLYKTWQRFLPNYINITTLFAKVYTKLQHFFT